MFAYKFALSPFYLTSISVFDSPKVSRRNTLKLTELLEVLPSRKESSKVILISGGSREGIFKFLGLKRSGFFLGGFLYDVSMGPQFFTDPSMVDF